MAKAKNITTDKAKDSSPDSSIKKSSQDPAPLSDKTHMHVKVYAPFKTYFDGIAKSISAVNDTGPFDILPQHHNFMTLINSCDLIVRTDQKDEKFTISRAVMHVKADIVIVFLDV